MKLALSDANLAARGGQRTPLRRLTRLEYGYTIADLLLVDEAIGSELALNLPAEADSGGFDTVAANQAMSPLHVQSYLATADRALDAALTVGPPPPVERYEIDYAGSRYLYGISMATGLGVGIVKQLDDAYVAFFDFGSTYTFHSMSEGVAIPYPGRYKVTVEAYPYQAETPVGLMVYRGTKAGVAASLDELIGSFDLTGDEPTPIELTPFMRPGDLIGMTPADLDMPPDVDHTKLSPADPSIGYREILKTYPGEGVALKSLTIEGPLLDAWPPESTRRLLAGVEFDEDGAIQLTKDPYAHVVDIVTAFAPRAFRRSVDDAEVEAYALLARPLLDEGRPFLDAVRVPLRAILSAPSFLFHGGSASSSAELDDVELATRLSYFLWRSTPDATLLELARDGRLSAPSVLTAQVERMLDDPKTTRFVDDFAGQAFRLYEMGATSPDPGIYPEYDDRLGQAMAKETRLFVAELIAENLGVGSLIDADFTFLNRRLAEHYGVPGVVGMEMRKVDLPPDSPRGGLLTQASVHKITANGTTTSPIPRGNFVLANLLGRPAPPPPAAVDIPEPDTRGTTTIREQLDAHRASPVCANCHRTIDPPGFAMESFDPIGGFRTSYRISGGTRNFGDFEVAAPYAEGAPVDASGVTPDGDRFTDIDAYKRLLLENELDAVARHLASQLLVFSTGAEVEFADRATVDAILDAGRAEGHPMRTMIHRVVGSDLFKSR
ncbi:MAG: DUF1592 domain-containing protein [Acidobacteria bacterium]|nr:DUF1592 domain-containing protein [Acidobacteriota bacterium]